MAGTWERARRPEQKEQRRAAIVAAAIGLVDAGGIDGAGLSAIARASGISKANLYRYFESREAILLQVLADEMDAWELRIRDALRPGVGIEEVADVMARATAESPRLCTLSAGLGTVLEHNLSADTVAAFKRGTNEVMGRLVGSIVAALPGLPVDGVARFLRFHYMVAVGAWPHARPSPVVEEVLSTCEDLAHMRVDFIALLRDHAVVALRGLLTQAG